MGSRLRLSPPALVRKREVFDSVGAVEIVLEPPLIFIPSFVEVLNSRIGPVGDLFELFGDFFQTLSHVESLATDGLGKEMF